MIADGNLLHANVNDTNPGVNDGATNADESAYADESERGAVDAPESSASDDESSDDEDANEEDSDEEQEAEAEERGVFFLLLSYISPYNISIHIF